MNKDTIVWWSTKRLAKELNLSTMKVGKILKSIGAKKWSNQKSNRNSIWYWDSEED